MRRTALLKTARRRLSLRASKASEPDGASFLTGKYFRGCWTFVLVVAVQARRPLVFLPMVAPNCWAWRWPPSAAGRPCWARADALAVAVAVRLDGAFGRCRLKGITASRGAMPRAS